MISQSRNAAMGEMISMISHQWRQPLNIITLGANNILLDIELDDFNQEKTQGSMKTILKQSEYLSKIINDFKDYFNPREKKEQISIKTIISDTKNIIEFTLNNNSIDLIVENNCDNGNLYVYEKELIQVLLNLINNSKDAFTLTNKDEKKIKITIKENEQYLTIIVCDNAGGIDNKIINTIFEPYFTTKKEMNGVGIGLYMSKIIIEKYMGGELRVQSKGEGACFTIKLAKKKIS